MDSRLFQTLLYFLPGNLHQSPDNPLQLDRLPDVSNVELDYPVYQERPAAAARNLGTILFLSALMAPALDWAIYFLPASFLDVGLNTVALLAAGVLVVLGIFGRRWPLGSFGIAAAAVPVLALLVREVLICFTGSETFQSQKFATGWSAFNGQGWLS